MKPYSVNTQGVSLRGTYRAAELRKAAGSFTRLDTEGYIYIGWYERLGSKE